MKADAATALVDKAIDSAVDLVISDFQHCTAAYFSEEDVRWRLLAGIDYALSNFGLKMEHSRDGRPISLVHGEYPTPFRCSMAGGSFELRRKESRAKRGHFDIAVLSPDAVAHCDFDVARSQDYRRLLDALERRQLPLPFLACAVEVKLYRDLADPNRAEPARQQVQHAMQAIRKLDAALQGNEYYRHPFVRRGIVLLFDNSDLVCAGSVERARNQLVARPKDGAAQHSLSSALSGIWVTQRTGKTHVVQARRGRVRSNSQT
jgi:hypothetical protein